MLKELPRPEFKEKAPRDPFTITVIGAACSGKSTLLGSLEDRGYTVRPEPDNPVMRLFLENPKKYAFQNQLHKTTQLMQEEILDTKAEGLTDPHFRESGVLATDIYNKYLHDQGLLSDEQFKYLKWLYENHLNTFPKPDLVVYLFASDQEIKDRAVKRDGLVAHDPHELQPYWDRLILDLENRGIQVMRLDTGKFRVEQSQNMILQEVAKMKRDAEKSEPLTVNRTVRKSPWMFE